LRVAILAAGLLALVAGAGCFGEDDPLATDPATALAPAEVADAFAVLADGDSDELPVLLGELVERGDRRFVAPLIEVLRASQLGLLGSAHHNALVVTLERLTGQPLGADWFAWVAWYRDTPLRAPPGFAAFKAQLVGRIDPVLGDFVRASDVTADADLRPEELLWTGSGVDQPGALRAPPRVPAGESGLAPGEAVVGLAWSGAALAVPVRYLDWHEVLNDRHAGVDYVLVDCALCGSIAAFEAPAADDGTARVFATSGLLLRSVRLMYDDTTRTLWNELTGRAAFGPEAATGGRLRPLPVVLTTWQSWLEQHPRSSAVELPGGEELYQPGNPWGKYLISAETVFPVGMGRTELAPKTRVVGLEAGLRTKAWALTPLLAERVLHDEADGRPVVLVATRGPVEVAGSSPFVRELEYTVGAEVRAFAPGEQRFRPGSAPDTLEAADGGVWRVAEDALHGPAGERLPRQLLTSAFWFAWQAFHPATEVWPPAE
jgi:hypothetical protein